MCVCVCGGGGGGDYLLDAKEMHIDLSPVH